ncbi:ATP-binding protein [Thalassotalea euphylliae]|uniref:ATP-binding protein n=1 Tax=Thalassotalea euphylliae TaxID=1655234 RepID=UPI0011C051FF|nr:ATP-binding protein [Thalassotalea euphylliae]
MNRNISPVNLFSRYNFAVFTLFILLACIAIGGGAYRYQHELASQLTRSQQALAEQAEMINHSLAQSQQSLLGLKQFAQYYLSHPKELHTKRPSLVQDGDSYYLARPVRDELKDRKRLQGNITGRGEIAEFDNAMWQELAMASALTPGFVTASHNNPDATWFYYLSLNRFVSIFPWIGHQAWRYSDHMLNETFVWQVRQQNLAGEPFFWSQPYQDAAGKGLKAAIGTGVFLTGSFKGALVIDVDLASLQQKLPQVDTPGHGYVLVNRQGSALVHQVAEERELTANSKWRDIVPDGLQTLTQANLMSFKGEFIYRDWLLQKQHLAINGWSLIHYQPYSDFAQQLQNRIIYTVLLFIVGLMVFLGLVYVMTRKTFIKPATEFISHIEYCAQGSPGVVKPTKEWLPWFRLVENIFSENSSLLLQLKQQNAELDSRVEEKTQALIERSEEQRSAYVLLRSVINGIPEYIIFYDDQDLLTGCNKSFERYIGQQEAQLLGQDIHTLLLPPILHTLKKFASNLPQAQSFFGYQDIVETSGDTYEVFCTRYFNDAGQSLGSIAILRDVSVQTAVQSTLQSAKDQAEQANQAKSQFLANMSHEIRTPINAIQGMMALLQKTSLSAFQQQYLSNAQNASSALLHLIDELLDLSKIEAGKLRLNENDTVFDGVIERVLQLNTLAAHQKGLALLVELDADIPSHVVVDEMRLTQVLTNLINNAVKFTHKGKVSLTVNVAGKDEKNVLLKFVVADTGIGIAKEKQAKLFDAFMQADASMTREYGGSGLGLSISQQIVGLFGGQIKVNSTPAKGSEFSFVIPLRLAPENEQELRSMVTIVTLGFTLPSSVQHAIQSYHWRYQALENIAQLDTLESSGDIVILVKTDTLAGNKPEGEQLNDEPSHQPFNLAAIESRCSNVALIGLCQPIMASISETLFSQLSELNTPYLLFDNPLYRHTLTKINQHLLLGANTRAMLANKSAENQPESTTPNGVSGNNDNALKTGPATKPSATASASKVDAPLAGTLANVNVLLVEDNIVNQMVAKELLASMGAQVIVAENGLVALALLAEHVFDVVLMDIQMPEMDGLTATQKIREQSQFDTLPIIAMTAHARSEDKTASIAAGMNLHIAKPVSAEVLSQSIVDVLSLSEINS